MKSNVEVSYYSWETERQVHVNIEDTDLFLILFEYDNEPTAWEIHHAFSGDEAYAVPDFTVLSEEELFQWSVVWDAPLDFYAVQAIQKHVLELKPTWYGDTCYNTDLEY